jgi:hypothetical protein
MVLLKYNYSLQGQGILAIGRNREGAFNAYRFNADPLYHEETFSDISLYGQSVGSITALPNQQFKIITYDAGPAETAIFNYSSGELYYENGASSSDANNNGGSKIGTVKAGDNRQVALYETVYLNAYDVRGLSNGLSYQ